MTDNRPLPERMFEAGFTDLIPVIPPGASLAPTSKIPPGSAGKIPGKRTANNLWVGMNWREIKATIDDVRLWHNWGANVGLRSDRFPGVDIDCADESLAQIVEDAATSCLGPAPVRIGNPPKRLLPYRTTEPFGRMRLWMRRGDQHFLVEVLGQGTQYLVSGTHPTTRRPYQWNVDPAGLTADGLTCISKESASAFLDHVLQLAEMLGYECEREGDGRQMAERKGDQAQFLAPSMDELREVVERLPNTNTMFPSRTDWLKVGYAIRAAAGEENEPEAFDLFSYWSSKWEGNGRSEGNTPEYVRNEWRRIKGPYSVGWSWLSELARKFGYNDSPFAVEAEAPSPTPTKEEDDGAPFLSDQWLALKIVEMSQSILRYSPMMDKWFVWDRGRWQPDAVMLAEDVVKTCLRKIARKYQGAGTTEKEKQKWEQECRSICSSGKATAVRVLVQSDRAIAVSPESLDYNLWILNTPGGIIDLTTGNIQDSDPDQLCTKSTVVAPDFGMPTPLWTAFLEEATGGDIQLQAYLRRLGGYALTGSTREQQFCFIYGPGGNGKGVFLNTLKAILGDYARTAPMDTFTAATTDKHATDLAGLAGARLVVASETESGKRWDEPKLKSMTGGDDIAARFMHKDFFTYTPQFKLIFIGNYKPDIRNIDEAMRRRAHIVPFTVKPKVKDLDLREKLRAEWPGILAWLVRGCLEWQKEGLNPPASVAQATEEYFAENDPVGQWILECCVESDEPVALLEMWDSWQAWSRGRGEYTGKIQRLAQVLEAKGYQKRKDPKSRAVTFTGVKPVNRLDPMEVMTNA